MSRHAFHPFSLPPIAIQLNPWQWFFQTVRGHELTSGQKEPRLLSLLQCSGQFKWVDSDLSFSFLFIHTKLMCKTGFVGKENAKAW